MDIGAYAISQHSKGNLLYSAPTAQSTMDYSSKAVDDGVVDRPLSRGAPLAVNSSSPLRGKGKLQSSELNWRDSNGAQRNLCLRLSSASHPRSVMVELSYHSLPAVCIGNASFNSKFRNESHIFRKLMSSLCIVACTEVIKDHTLAPLASASYLIHSSQWRKPHGSL